MLRLFAIALLLPSLALAQAFPSKPIRMVVPFTPAGAVDIATRATANEMTKVLGQPVAVENKPGAGGNLGVLDVSRSAPDGYSVVMSTSGIQAINPFLYSKMPLDVNKDLAPVAAIVSLNNVLVVNPSFPPRSVKEVIEITKKNPGKYTYASSGAGTSIHMSGAMFTQFTHTDIVHIPYKGSAPAVTDLIAGQVQVMFDNTPNVLPHVKAGKLKALAVSSKSRTSQAPEIPTVDEAGVPGYDVGVWFGVLTVAGTPRPIVQRLNAAMVKVLTSPDVKERFGKVGVDVVADSPEHFSQFLKSEVARWAKVVQDAGIKAD